MKNKKTVHHMSPITPATQRRKLRTEYDQERERLFHETTSLFLVGFILVVFFFFIVVAVFFFSTVFWI